MSIDPSKVSAVIVTYGGVDLTEIRESLIFDEIVVWDNSANTSDMKTWGRAYGALIANHRVIYSQDDDILHTPEDQHRILDAYEPGVLTGCMWTEWSDGARRQGIPGGYDDLAFAGSGSVYDWKLPWLAAARYLQHFPLDDFFRLWADCIVGILAPTKNLPIVFEELAAADEPYRMCKQPDAAENKAEAIRRARWVRDLGEAKPDAHAVYMREITQGRYPEHRFGEFAA